MTKRTIAIKFDREKFCVKEIANIMNMIYRQIDDTIQIIPMFDGMEIYDVNIFESKDNLFGGMYFYEFIEMKHMNQIIEEMIKAPLNCEDFDEWQEKLP